VVSKASAFVCFQRIAPLHSGNGQLTGACCVFAERQDLSRYDYNWAPRVGWRYRATPTIAVRAGFGHLLRQLAAVTADVARIMKGLGRMSGSSLPTILNVPYCKASHAHGHRPKSFAVARRFPAPTPFQQVQWFLRSLQQESLFAAVNFGVAKQFNSSTTVNIDYVGSGSRRLDVGGY